MLRLHAVEMASTGFAPKMTLCPVFWCRTRFCTKSQLPISCLCC